MDFSVFMFICREELTKFHVGTELLAVAEYPGRLTDPGWGSSYVSTSVVGSCARSNYFGDHVEPSLLNPLPVFSK